MVDISLLLSNTEDEIIVDEVFTYEEDYLKNTNIIDITPIKVTGTIKKDSSNLINIDLRATGSMNLPCSITLKPVNFPINIKINEQIDENDENNLKKDENTLELKDYLWENIVVEIPLRIVSDDAYNKKYEGDGWKLITDEDKKISKNKSFEVLEQLLNKEEE